MKPIAFLSYITKHLPDSIPYIRPHMLFVYLGNHEFFSTRGRVQDQSISTPRNSEMTLSKISQSIFRQLDNEGGEERERKNNNNKEVRSEH